MAKPLATLLCLTCGLSAGCVALNIPSERHQDPSDHGGVFGAWENPVRPGRVLKKIVNGPDADCGRSGCDDFVSVDGSVSSDFTSDFGGQPPPSPPEVPWPKYHPIPTRPVFGDR